MIFNLFANWCYLIGQHIFSLIIRCNKQYIHNLYGFIFKNYYYFYFGWQLITTCETRRNISSFALPKIAGVFCWVLSKFLSVLPVLLYRFIMASKAPTQGCFLKGSNQLVFLLFEFSFLQESSWCLRFLPELVFSMFLSGLSP